MTKVFAVRIGEKYGKYVEDYLNSKISGITWIRDEQNDMKLQWNKLRFMNMDIDEPIVVIDIDMLFINDYMEAIEYPIKRGEFLTFKSWWGDTGTLGYSLNGGFQKYYPKDCKFIYNEFIKNRTWENFYIDNKITVGPVNGEQYFVEDMLRSRNIKINYLPDEWVFCITKSFDDDSDFSKIKMNLKYFSFSDEYAYLDDFNKHIKIVHFMNTDFGEKEILKFDKSSIISCNT